MSITTQLTTAPGVLTALGIAVESVYGQSVAPTSYIPYTEHNLAISNKLITNTAVRKSIGMPQPGIGSVEAKGTITTLVDADSIGPMLAASFGLDTVTATGGNGLHVFKMQNPLNSYTLAADDNQGTIQSFTGCKVNQFDASCKAGGFLEIKLDVMGQTAVVTNGSLSPTFSSRPEFEFAHLGTLAGGVTTIAGSGFNIQDFSITMKNNLKQHYGSQGGRFVVGMDQTTREVTGSFTLQLDQATGTIANNALWGSPTGPAPGVLARLPIVITFTQTVSAGLAPSISFTLGQITVQDVAESRKRNDVIIQQVKFMASESVLGAADDLQVTLLNSNTVAYS